jgi:hypothetical protein
MSLSIVVDLVPKQWYYNESTNTVYKILQNNTTYKHTTNNASGYVIIKQPDGKPELRYAETLQTAVENGAIVEAENNSINNTYSQHTTETAD